MDSPMFAGSGSPGPRPNNRQSQCCEGLSVSAKLRWYVSRGKQFAPYGGWFERSAESWSERRRRQDPTESIRRRCRSAETGAKIRVNVSAILQLSAE